MRIFLIILFISTLISKFTFQLGYEFYYHWNKTEITQKYCENKAKPKLACNGKCHLKKKLSAVEDPSLKFSKDKNSNKDSKSLKSKIYDSYWMCAELTDVHAFPSNSTQENEFSLDSFKNFEPNFGIDHPPCA
jgi:hypothetical protein